MSDFFLLIPSTRLSLACTSPMAVVSCQSSTHSETNQIRRDKRSSNSSSTNPKKNPSRCPSSSVSAASDIAVLVVILFACGYLSLPYLQLFCRGVKITFSTVRRDLAEIPLGVVKCVCVGFLALCVACFVVVRCLRDDRKCDNPNCKGLRNGREFDIKVTTEDCLRNSTSAEGDGVVDDAFFELGVDRYRKLEDRLKKLAPPSGRATLIFRANCGCPAGRMVVWGSKRRRKTKR